MFKKKKREWWCQFMVLSYRLSQEVFSELYSILWERTWNFPGIFYFTDLGQTRDAKKIPKIVLKTGFKTKETTYSLVSENSLLSLFGTAILGHFQCFWKIHWGLSQESDVLGKIYKQIRPQRTKNFDLC
jgi:hypothetical protein